jgi:hypothetical protein
VIYSHTKAFLTFNVFEESGDYPPYCDEKFHPNDARAIALSTGWYDNASRCLKHINVTANVTQLGVATKIMIMNLLVLTTRVVSASSTVWKALGVPHDQWSGLKITWSYA